MMRFSTPLVLAATLSALACNEKQAATPPPINEETTSKASAAAPADTATPAAQVEAVKVGAPAPDFELKDLDGKAVKLSSFKGKTVVLEWFNPGCPFVKAAHKKGSLVDTAKRHAEKGVVWLAINSGAEGKQGHGVSVNKEASEEWSMQHPLLLDPDGNVGRAYGAKTTPHMYVINPEGTLVYAGAIDNSPDGEGNSPKEGKLINYVDEALLDVAAGKPVRTPTTEAYGCSVKYKS